jgi:hypothetical protein
MALLSAVSARLFGPLFFTEAIAKQLGDTLTGSEITRVRPSATGHWPVLRWFGVIVLNGIWA